VIAATRVDNPKKLSEYIGHSDIRTTYNVYGHLMPGSGSTRAHTRGGKRML
jgi:hypothetical protein